MPERTASLHLYYDLAQAVPVRHQFPDIKCSPVPESIIKCPFECFSDGAADVCIELIPFSCDPAFLDGVLQIFPLKFPFTLDMQSGIYHLESVFEIFQAPDLETFFFFILLHQGFSNPSAKSGQ